LKLMADRNLTSHTYHEDLAKELLERIRRDYLPLFEQLKASIVDNSQE
ncbi:MAG: nucleotidyltransferase substrate binding protein, partial [Deltaproteobacteria bacterium]|nr:nucleotidyltransferase substrate binding protein [Deltaproteobacteria bacterium]